MHLDFEQNLIHQLNQWMKNSQEMTLLTHRLKDEVCQTFDTENLLTESPTCRILPVITVFKNDVYCDGIRIPTAKKGRAIELFKAFLRNPNHSFTREELTNEIYGAPQGQARTARLDKALKHNTTKLISRTRIIAEQAVNTESRKWIEWFCYDAERGLWSFFRITNARLLEIQKNLEVTGAQAEREAKVRI